MPFTLYVALGDSMSTDHYPTCDVRGLDVPPVRLDPLGAAALLLSAHPELSPDAVKQALVANAAPLTAGPN